MTTSEAHRLIASLKAAYPRQEITPETLFVYTRHLARLDYEHAETAADQHIAESPFFPTIAELTARAKAVGRAERGEPEPDPEPYVELTPKQLADLKEWANRIGGRMDDVLEAEPMPDERWFAEHAEEMTRLANAPRLTEPT